MTCIVSDDQPDTSLQILTEQIIQPFGPSRFIVYGSHCIFSSDYASAYTVLLNELCANSSACGALNSHTGYVRIDWHASEDQRIYWTWQEFDSANDYKDAYPGILSTTLNKLQNTQIKLDFKPEGLMCQLHIEQ